jgi:glycosyltransferase 2 family protein
MKAGGTLAALYLVYVSIDINSLFDILGKINLRIYFIAALLFTIMPILSAFRWKIILGNYNISTKYSESLRLIMITLFYNIYLPGGIVGEGVRIIKMKGCPNYNITNVSASVFMDRIIGMFSLLLLGFGSLLVFQYDLIYNYRVELLLIIGTGIFIFAVLNLFFMNFLRRFIPGTALVFLSALTIVLKDYRLLFTSVVISLLSHTAIITSYYFVAKSLSLQVQYSSLLQLIPVVDVLSTLPISLGGVGVREYFTIQLFSLVGTDQESALALSVTLFTILLAFGLLGGLLHLFEIVTINKKEVN